MLRSSDTWLSDCGDSQVPLKVQTGEAWRLDHSCFWKALEGGRQEHFLKHMPSSAKRRRKYPMSLSSAWTRGEPGPAFSFGIHATHRLVGLGECCGKKLHDPSGPVWLPPWHIGNSTGAVASNPSSSLVPPTWMREGHWNCSPKTPSSRNDGIVQLYPGSQT